MPAPKITAAERWPGVYQIYSGFNRALNEWIKGETDGQRRYHFDGGPHLARMKAWYIPGERVPDLAEWCAGRNIEFASVDKPATLPPEVLDLPTDLTPWQEQGVLRALGQRVLLAQWITGAGKSRFAIEVYRALQRGRAPNRSNPKALIVCPKVVMRTWETEQLPKWLPQPEPEADEKGKPIKIPPPWWALIQGRKLDRPQPDIVIVSYGSLHKIPKDWRFDLIVYDELHYGIHGGSARSKAATDLAIKNEDAIRIGLTATPTSASLTDLWSQLNILCPHRWGSYNSWWRYYFEEVLVGFEDYTEPGPLRSDRIEELLASLATVCDYVSHEEVGDRLPPVEWKQIGIGGENKTAAITPPESIKNWRLENMALGETRAAAFEIHWRGLPPEAREKQTAIITYHRNVAEDLAERLGASYVSGELSPKQRHATLADPDNGLAVMTMRSVTEGLDLRAYTQVYVLECYPVPLYLTQVLGRFVRLFATEPVTIHFCRLAGSSDDFVVHRLLGRMEEQARLLQQGKTESGLKNLLTLDENSEDFLAELRAACDSMDDDDEGAGADWDGVDFDWEADT